MVPFVRFIKNKSSCVGFFSLGSVPGLLSFKNSEDLVFVTKNLETFSNVSYSWTAGNYMLGGTDSLWFLFLFFWFNLLFFITFLNVGLTSLLFLLEVALLTPIVMLPLLQTVPLSAMLYLLNAITMEAVVGVIVALCYSRDWGHRDFTKYETLESSFFVKKLFPFCKSKKSAISKNSWSGMGPNLKLVVFTIGAAALTICIKNFNTPESFNLSNSVLFVENVDWSHGDEYLSAFLDIFKKTNNFVNTKSVDFSKNNLQDFKKTEARLRLRPNIFSNYRLSNNLSFKNNPHNLLTNFITISGSYHDSVYNSRNNTKLFDRQGREGLTLWGGTRFSGKLAVNVTESAQSSVFSDILNYERLGSDYFLSDSVKLNRSGYLEFLGGFGNFGLILGDNLAGRIPIFLNILNFKDMVTPPPILDSSPNNLFWGGFKSPTLLLKKTENLKNIDYSVWFAQEKYENFKFKKILNGGCSVTKTRINNKLVFLGNTENRFGYLSYNIPKTEVLEKFLGLKKKRFKNIRQLFYKKKINKLEKIYEFNQETITYFSTLGELYWGDKKRSSIFGIESKNLPWFENGSVDEQIVDKTSSLLFTKKPNQFEIATIGREGAEFVVGLGETLTNKQRLLKKKKLAFSPISKKKKTKFNIFGKFRHFKKRDRIRQKSKIWKLSVNWNYEHKSELLYKNMYKNVATIFKENELLLHRPGFYNKPGPVADLGQISKFGNVGFDNRVGGLRSPQSRDFGLINLTTAHSSYFINKTNTTDFNNIKIKSKRLFSYGEATGPELSDFYKKLGRPSPRGVGLGSDVENFGQITNDLFSGLSSSKPIENFSDKIVNFDYYAGDSFDKKLSVFWTLKNTTQGYNDFDKKKIVEDRFLKTFSKIIEKRDHSSSNLLSRNYKIPVLNKQLLRFLHNSFRMAVIPKCFSKENTLMDSSQINKINNIGKITIIDDLEPYSKNTRAVTQKPHTVYGLLWDEYLKHTYGFSLNFLDFENKINKLGNSAPSSLKGLTTFGDNFQKRVEKSLSVYDKFTGLTKDSAVGNEISLKLLTRLGFFKEIDPLSGEYSEYVGPGSKPYAKIRNKFWSQKRISTFKQKKKIKNYLKKKILKDTIDKSALVKQSIGLLKKFSETPTGYKYDNTETGINLPYLKKNIWIKNEYEYTSSNRPVAGSWKFPKNFTVNTDNRWTSARLKNAKFLIEGGVYVKKKKYYRKLLKSYGSHFCGFSDYKKKIKNKRRGLRYFTYCDKNESILKNGLKDRLKRNLNRIKSRRGRKFSRKFSIMKLSTLDLFTKNRTKRFKNFKLFFKTNTSIEDIVGGGVSSYRGGFEKIRSQIFYESLFRQRVYRVFGDFNIFENSAVKQYRSGELHKYLELKKLQANGYLNYKKTRNSDVPIWGLGSLLKNYKFDANINETTLSEFIRGSNRLSDFYSSSAKNVASLSLYQKSFYLDYGSISDFSVFQNFGENSNFEVSVLENNAFRLQDNSYFRKSKINNYFLRQSIQLSQPLNNNNSLCISSNSITEMFTKLLNQKKMKCTHLPRISSKLFKIRNNQKRINNFDKFFSKIVLFLWLIPILFLIKCSKHFIKKKKRICVNCII